jgi:hypothetical protein
MSVSERRADGGGGDHGWGEAAAGVPLPCRESRLGFPGLSGGGGGGPTVGGQQGGGGATSTAGGRGRRAGVERKSSSSEEKQRGCRSLGRQTAGETAGGAAGDERGGGDRSCLQVV